MPKIKIVIFIFLFSLSVWSQEDSNEIIPDEPEVAIAPSKKRIDLSYEDELLKDGGPNPSVEYIFTRSQFNFKKMIKLREDFIPEATRGKGEFNASH